MENAIRDQDLGSTCHDYEEVGSLHLVLLSKPRNRYKDEYMHIQTHTHIKLDILKIMDLHWHL